VLFFGEKVMSWSLWSRRVSPHHETSCPWSGGWATSCSVVNCESFYLGLVGQPTNDYKERPKPSLSFFFCYLRFICVIFFFAYNM
jgi:predicted membrane-bound mannosyltransferase